MQVQKLQGSNKPQHKHILDFCMICNFQEKEKISKVMCIVSVCVRERETETERPTADTTHPKKLLCGT